MISDTLERFKQSDVRRLRTKANRDCLIQN